eukprot:scaffold24593_cov60-Phaeocystis_antarctica.AAC.2
MSRYGNGLFWGAEKVPSPPLLVRCSDLTSFPGHPHGDRDLLRSPYAPPRLPRPNWLAGRRVWAP